jgi:hypothetical protein
MRYLGDFAEDATLDFTFNTQTSAGAPTTLGGSPAVAVYKANGTTETTAGVTLSVDFDSRTGLHQVRIDTSANAYYATGNDYNVVLTQGSVGGQSVAGATLATFSIENRSLTDAALSESDSTNLIAVINALLDGGRVDLLIDAIKAKTDVIPAVPATAGNQTTIIANQGTMDGKLDTIDNVVHDILEDTAAGMSVTGGSGSTLRTEIERLYGINQATIYESDELFGVDTGDTTYVTWGKAVYDSDNSKTVLFYTTSDGSTNVIRRIDSTDGKTSWGNRADVAAPAGETWNAGGMWVGNVAIIDGTWYMLVSGRTAGGSSTVASTLSVGLYTSADGVTWAASASNPVLSPTLDWQYSSIEPTGLIQVGSMLHMFYTNLPTMYDRDECPIYARKIGRASAPVSDLTDWTDHGVVFGDRDDGYARQPYHGYYSAEPMKNGTNGFYYLIVAKYGAAADYSQFELWECPDIDFSRETRRRVGVIATTQDLGTFPDREWDIASVLTDDATKMVDSITATSDEIRIYAGCNHGGTWKQALLTFTDVHELLRWTPAIQTPVIDHLAPTRWENAGDDLSGVSLAATGLDLVVVGGIAMPIAIARIGAGVAGDQSELNDDGSESFYWAGAKVFTVTYAVEGGRYYRESTVYHE